MISIFRSSSSGALLLALVAPAPACAQSGEPTLRELAVIQAERDRQYGQRFDAQEKAVAAALAAAKEAVTKAEIASDKRFEGVNEFRKALTDQTATFPPRAEVDVRFKALEEKVALLTARQAQTAGSSEGADKLWAIIVGAIATAAGLTAIAVAIARRRAA